MDRVNVAANSMFSCQRLNDIKGFEGKRNNLIMFPFTESNVPTKKDVERHVIYFGGDVQNVPEEMETHRDNRRYVQWNLESTARLLHSKFPASQIWIVRPVAMSLKTFSVYSNFVHFNTEDIPQFKSGQNSWRHLSRLFINALTSSRNSPQVCGNEDASHIHPTLCDMDKCEPLPITLIGFSKGSVVLNQLLYDLATDSEDAESLQFIKRVDEIIWLDGGHNGHENLWVTDRRILEEAVKLKVKFTVAATPYQVRDSLQPWKARDHKKFVKTLQQLNANITSTMYFDDVAASLENHFKVLEVFR